MGHYEKTIARILSGRSDSNITFSEMRNVLSRLGFDCRVKGDHFIYAKDAVEEIINIQPVKDKAKPYQVKQVRDLIIKYRLGVSVDEI